MFSNFSNKLQETLSQLTDPHHSATADSALSSSPPTGPSSRTHALDQLTNSLRSLQVQYSPQVPAALRPLQLVITSEKTLSLAFESVAQASRNHSRDLYLWGQEQEQDVKDVSDRLAWLNFTSGALASQLGTALGGEARGPLKQLRDAEQLLAPRRAARAAAQAQLQRAKMEQERAELTAALKQGEAEDAELEGRVARARREGVREAERAKWLAVAQYAEKMLLLARGAEQLVELIPPAPTGAPTAANIALSHPAEYAGAQQTADVKSAVQHALDTYTPGELQPLSVPGQGAALSRAASDRRSFGETHLPQLGSDQQQQPTSALNPPTSGLTAPPPSAILPQPGRFVAPSGSPFGPVGAAPTSPSPPSGKPTSPLAQHPLSPPPLNPQVLNQAPAPLPPPTTDPSISPTTSRTTSAAAAAVPGLPVAEGTSTTTGAVPTIAETGLPIASSAQSGPGPKTGSLKREELHPPALPARASGGTGGSAQGGFPSAEEEKRALERKERDRILLGAGGSSAQGSGSSAPPSAYHAPSLPGGTGPPVPVKDAKTEDDLPPYAA
ncbi:hypothetical protein CALVIDRAFT_538488 [Calocera viscosa TUFC12733]|uniref:Sphingolipid long chain base-responsive protein LSP1 n=1 Tax=Calocera viscosa (strain TUFC12733) TaxID=1330018 RepID=A0A167KUA6_CALVF|nr:hypothetical protein CALVIDRAFT_538488 [Calocera viscosa TUFC12733]